MKTEPTEALKLIEDAESIVRDIEIEAVSKLFASLTCKVAFREGQSNPRIKQLEWEDTDMWYFKSKISLGLGYSITEIKGTYIVHFGDAPISWEKSFESAKSAAQADFEWRVKECLDL